ncbi:hypothetical protein IE4803_PB00339 (plasmid) [Rhizobium etli bv. phaseoli str. IE4803]|nr:hypothetical protein IE4803_PB00339 [Rhizobium etli bv. phaseoli str. IE4803]
MGAKTAAGDAEEFCELLLLVSSRTRAASRCAPNRLGSRGNKHKNIWLFLSSLAQEAQEENRHDCRG